MPTAIWWQQMQFFFPLNEEKVIQDLVIPMFSCIMSGPPFEMIRYLKALKKMTSPKAKRNNNKTAMTNEHIVISEYDKIQTCFQDFFFPLPTLTPVNHF